MKLHSFNFVGLKNSRPTGISHVIKLIIVAQLMAAKLFATGSFLGKKFVW